MDEKQNQTQRRQMAEKMVKEILADIIEKPWHNVGHESNIALDLDDVARSITEAIFYRNRFKEDGIILNIDEVYDILDSIDEVTFVKDYRNRNYMVVHGGVLHDVEYFVDENTYELLEKYYYESEDVDDEEIERRARLAAAKAAGYMKLLCETMWQFGSGDIRDGEAEAKRGSLYEPLMNLADLSDMICDIANILDIAVCGWSCAIGEKYDVDEYYKLAARKIAKKLLSKTEESKESKETTETQQLNAEN